MHIAFAHHKVKKIVSKTILDWEPSYIFLININTGSRDIMPNGKAETSRWKALEVSTSTEASTRESDWNSGT